MRNKAHENRPKDKRPKRNKQCTAIRFNGNSPAFGNKYAKDLRRTDVVPKSTTKARISSKFDRHYYP